MKKRICHSKKHIIKKSRHKTCIQQPIQMWMQKCNILSISPGCWDDPCRLRFCLSADIPGQQTSVMFSTLLEVLL